MYLVFSDLDGTLLDHHDYDWRAASPAIELLRKRHIPLILVSSKTKAEILSLREDLNNKDPFVSENGAALFYPRSYFKMDIPGAVHDQHLVRYSKGMLRSNILSHLNQLRESHGYEFTGFDDMGVEGIIEHTGLTPGAAARANQRDASEPLLWHDTAQRFGEFQLHLHALGLTTQQGGRFIQVQAPFTKSDALNLLCQHYRNEFPGKAIRSIALGDGPNDLGMLNSADVAVVIRGRHDHAMELPNRDVIRTTEFGPSGWNQAICALFESSATGTACV